MTKVYSKKSEIKFIRYAKGYKVGFKKSQKRYMALYKHFITSHQYRKSEITIKKSPAFAKRGKIWILFPDVQSGLRRFKERISQPGLQDLSGYILSGYSSDHCAHGIRTSSGQTNCVNQAPGFLYRYLAPTHHFYPDCQLDCQNSDLLFYSLLSLHLIPR